MDLGNAFKEWAGVKGSKRAEALRNAMGEGTSASASEPVKKKKKSFEPYIRDYAMSSFDDKAAFLKSIGKNPAEYDLGN